MCPFFARINDGDVSMKPNAFLFKDQIMIFVFVKIKELYTYVSIS